MNMLIYVLESGLDFIKSNKKLESELSYDQI